jgi:phosphoenolpyruvate---glycerone phosphotransferase subunit DhaL
MPLTQEVVRSVVRAMVDVIVIHADELTALDQAIGDGDHGVNMKRGFEAVLADINAIAAKPLPQALNAIGMTLVMKVGGASGPLFGTLFMQFGKALPENASVADFATAADAALAAVKARGKSDVGCKTMLDVLAPTLQALHQNLESAAAVTHILPSVADAAAEATRPMRATRGRASFLGERSIGTVDPGARSSALLIGAVCGVLEAS